MTQRPLNPEGGEARRFQLRLPDDLLNRVTAAVRRDSALTVSGVVRDALEQHLPELEAAIGPPG